MSNLEDDSNSVKIKIPDESETCTDVDYHQTTVQKQNNNAENKVKTIKIDRNTNFKYVSETNNSNTFENDTSGGLYGGRKRQEFWVMFNFASAGRQIPPGGGEPLEYEPYSRNNFVKMVFMIVLIMLLCTMGFVMSVMFIEPVNVFFISFGMFLVITAMVGMLLLNYAMACSACTRTPPCNIVCLVLAVIFMSIIAAYVTSRYSTRIVFFALIVTIGVVFVCIGLACTSFDFTKYLIYVVAIAAVFGIITVIYIIVTLVMKQHFKTLHLIILIVGSLLNVAFLIMELQMILGGRAVELSEDDYALGAFMLYTSIVDFFLKMVQILGIFEGDNW